MTPQHVAPDQLSDDDLLAEVKRLAGAERRATAALVRSLAELDARRIYLGEGCASLFVYCTQVLHLAEGAEYASSSAARSAPPLGSEVTRFSRNRLRSLVMRPCELSGPGALQPEPLAFALSRAHAGPSQQG